MRAFVIAMECEADCVRPFLRPGERLYVAGIGKVNAAAAAQRAICEGADEIWNVGVCGGFGDDVEVGDVFGVDRAVEYDFDLATLNGTAVGVLNEYDTPYIELQTREVLAGRDGEGAVATRAVRGCRTLATGDRFNDGEDDYELIVKTLGASLRDMEGAAIAHVCKRSGVRCVSVKCVTNVAGKGLMTGQYAENLAMCLKKLENAMKEIL